MKTMLVLNITPELEDELIDYLLSLKEITGFNSYPIKGHGEHSHLSISEQVSGRQKRIQFELILEAENVSLVLQNLGTEVGTGIKYWQLPLNHVGRT